MNDRMTLSQHRVITPIAAFLMAIALVAALALGFALRTWTESSSATSAPTSSVQSFHPSTPQPLVRMGRPW